MYMLKEKTKKMSSFVLGMNNDVFKNFDYDDEIIFLRSKGRDCVFLPDDDRMVDISNPLLARGEFLFMDDVNKELFAE